MSRICNSKTKRDKKGGPDLEEAFLGFLGSMIERRWHRLVDIVLFRECFHRAEFDAENALFTRGCDGCELPGQEE